MKEIKHKRNGLNTDISNSLLCIKAMCRKRKLSQCDSAECDRNVNQYKFTDVSLMCNEAYLSWFYRPGNSTPRYTETVLVACGDPTPYLQAHIMLAVTHCKLIYSVQEKRANCFERDSPAHEGGNDDTPGRAAAVGVGLLTALFAAAAEPE